jgi:uncharacterized protein DUF3800
VPEVINVYCDESCHLENDHQRAMVLGALWCPKDHTSEAAERVREIKVRHEVARNQEVKWTKVSPAKVQLYLDLVDFFFDDHDLHFRALIVPDKDLLQHGAFAQTHDDWYYKMYFDLLKVIIDPQLRYHIYLDLKDTRGQTKVKKLHDVLANANYDFSRQIVERIQLVRSHEVELLQITDILIGAVSYVSRGLNSSTAKMMIVERVRHRSHYNLTQTTLLRESKLNLFRWHASGMAA